MDKPADFLEIDPTRADWPGVWIQYRGPVWGKIRPLNKAIMDELRAKATTEKRRYRQHKLVIEKVLDEELFDTLINEHVFEDWKGIVCKGEPLPRTPENVAAVVVGSSSFINWGVEAAGDLGDDYERLSVEHEQKWQAHLKNSQSSHGGSPTAPQG